MRINQTSFHSKVLNCKQPQNEWLLEQGMYGTKVDVCDQTQSDDDEVPKYLVEDGSREDINDAEDALNHQDADPNLAIEEKEGWHG